MSDRVYDTLKWIGLIAVPVITFLTSVVNILGVPHGDQVVSILAALDILIGAIVTIAKVEYEKKQKKNAIEVNVESSDEEVNSEIEAINDEEGADA